MDVFLLKGLLTDTGLPSKITCSFATGGAKAAGTNTNNVENLSEHNIMVEKQTKMSMPLLKGLLTETELSSTTPSFFVTDDAAASAGANNMKKLSKRHRVQHCSAINCKNNRFDNPDLSFFKYPNDEERCHQWKVNSRRVDIQRKTAKQLNSGTVLYSLHFEGSHFTSSKKNYLRKDAVPTLFDVSEPTAMTHPERQALKARLFVDPKPAKHPFIINSPSVATKQTKLTSTIKLSSVKSDDAAALFLESTALPSMSHPEIQGPKAKFSTVAKSAKCTSSLSSPSVQSDDMNSSTLFLESIPPPLVTHRKRSSPKASLCTDPKPAKPISFINSASVQSGGSHCSGVFVNSTKLKDLKNKLERQRKKIKRLEKLKKARSPKEEINTIKELSSKYLNKCAHDFFCQQLDASQCKLRGSRYNARDTSLALSLLHASPKAYMFLRKIFFLPSIQTLKNGVKKID